MDEKEVGITASFFDIMKGRDRVEVQWYEEDIMDYGRSADRNFDACGVYGGEKDQGSGCRGTVRGSSPEGIEGDY